MSTPAATVPAADPKDDFGIWVGSKEAVLRLKTHRGHLVKLVEQGLIRCRRLPGAFPRYALEDIERVIKSAATR